MLIGTEFLDLHGTVLTVGRSENTIDAEEVDVEKRNPLSEKHPEPQKEVLSRRTIQAVQTVFITRMTKVQVLAQCQLPGNVHT